MTKFFKNDSTAVQKWRCLGLFRPGTIDHVWTVIETVVDQHRSIPIWLIVCNARLQPLFRVHASQQTTTLALDTRFPWTGICKQRMNINAPTLVFSVFIVAIFSCYVRGLTGLLNIEICRLYVVLSLGMVINGLWDLTGGTASKKEYRQITSTLLGFLAVQFEFKLKIICGLLRHRFHLCSHCRSTVGSSLMYVDRQSGYYQRGFDAF